MIYKIKKSGWVYWLHKEFNSEVYNKLREKEPVGLCLFFWNTIFQMFKVIAVTLLLILVGVLFIWGFLFILNFPVGLLSLVFGFELPFVDYELAAVQTVLVLLVGFAWILVEVFLKLIGSNASDMEIAPDYLVKVLPKKEDTSDSKQKGLTRSYWKAFREKVCPLVELEK